MFNQDYVDENIPSAGSVSNTSSTSGKRIEHLTLGSLQADTWTSSQMQGTDLVVEAGGVGFGWCKA